jgi:hypothetical protein
MLLPELPTSQVDIFAKRKPEREDDYFERASVCALYRHSASKRMTIWNA